MKTFLSVVLLCFPLVFANAQRVPKYKIPADEGASPATMSIMHSTPLPLAVKRPGHYTLADWRRLIDSAWGPGMSTTQKLQTFDAFWNKVEQTWGGFPNLVVKWDSLRNVYRPLVEAGVSRGRFYGILSRLTRALKEWHVYAEDLGIDSDMGINPLDDSQYPNLPSFQYKPGIPLFVLAPFFRTYFGAGVTSIGDSLGLVYSVMPNHPLNLQPGDIILGYDGRSWKQLVSEIFDAELPTLNGGPLGSTSEAAAHCAAISSGLNWGLYDTIDVLKYPTNDTLHLATSRLNSITPPYLIATEELPVQGVPFPDIAANKLVSWGVVGGTSIGYVYAWDWYGVPDGNTSVQFAEAIDDLMHSHDLKGMILDFRTNFGGWEHYANGGFRHLFNIDPTNNYARAWRTVGNDHFLFTTRQAYAPDFFTPTPEIFDHPIAVLTGPICGSAGDYNAFRLRFHPMVRFFGKPTAGAYTDLDENPFFTSNGYLCRVDPACVYSNVNNEAYMIHKTFPVDEEVWLTREGVAKGEDDVVKRALRWINTLSYVHDASALNPYVRPGVDSITITAVLTNPGGDSMAASFVVKNSAGVVQDSVVMMNDGLHGDGSPGDSILGARFSAPPTEDLYTIDLRTRDYTIGSSRLLPAVALCTTAGPVVCVGDTASTIPQWGVTVALRLKVTNNGTTASTPAIAGTIRSLDTAATVVWGNQFVVGDITPGQVRISSQIQITFSSWAAGTRDLRFELLFSSNSIQCWRDTLKIRVVDPVGIVQDLQELPTIFGLDQNYPNPFNPVTKIGYSVGVVSGQSSVASSHVRLVVYDLLGREAAALLDEQKAPGRYQVEFDGAELASGVYICRMTAGDFAQSRTMMLLK
jgi:hypothetical protein